MVHIFLTGASGSMGTTLIPHLLNANYTVSGLARSDASAAKISALGATPVKGDLTDFDAIAQAASQADIVIHMGFDHGQAFSGDFVGACNKDVAVVDAICSALTKGTGKAFYFASGTLGLDGTDEHADMHRSEHMPRFKSTDAAFSYISKGLRVVQLRLAPITYNSDRPHDFIGMWVGESKKAGYVAYTENGAWPAATYVEAAEIVLAALAKQDSLPNPVSLHLLAEEGVPFKDCADVLGKKLDLPVKQIEPAELQQLGFLGNLMGLARQPVKAEYTRQTVGWQPKGSSLVKQLGEYSYA